MIGIIQRNGNRRKTKRFSGLCTGENNILHVSSTQLFCTLFSQYPADSIADIALSTSVRTYDAGDTVMEFKYDLIGKGFESLYFDTL